MNGVKSTGAMFSQCQPPVLGLKAQPARQGQPTCVEAGFNLGWT